MIVYAVSVLNDTYQSTIYNGLVVRFGESNIIGLWSEAKRNGGSN